MDSLLEKINLFQKNWGHKNDGYYLAKLVEEVGEVAEAFIADMYDSKSKQKKIEGAGQTVRERQIEESGDVLRMLITMNLRRGISWDEIIAACESKLDKSIIKKQSEKQS